MMSRMVAATLLGILLTTTAYAADWYHDAQVDQLQYSVGADGVHIVYSGGTGSNNPDGCDVGNKFILAYTSSEPDRQKAMLSGLSMAFAAGKRIDVYLNGCMGGIGGLSYPKVYYLFVRK